MLRPLILGVYGVSIPYWLGSKLRGCLYEGKVLDGHCFNPLLVGV